MDETIGVRELKMHASEILKCVREDGATYTVTHRGRAVARLTPIQPRRHKYASVEELLASFDELSAEIGRHLPPDTDAVETVREMRREL